MGLVVMVILKVKSSRGLFGISRNGYYLVKLFFAEPLVLHCDIFACKCKVSLQVVPGAGDDGPAGDHPQPAVAQHSYHHHRPGE